MAKKAPTAYFIFSEEKRLEAREECMREAANEKISVTTVAKRIGEKWRALSEEDKKRYKDLAAEKAVAKSAPQECASTGATEESPDKLQDPVQDKPRDKRKHDSVHLSALPHASVKRIMCMDPEVQRVSGDAVALMARVIIPFLDLLAEKSLSSARQHKRRTIKFQDVEWAVRSDRRFIEMGLKDVLATEAQFADARTDSVEGKENVSGNKPHSAKLPGQQGKPITSFFSKSNP